MKQIDLNNEIVIYQSEDGKTQLDVKLEGETVWLNRQQLAELFGRDVKTIGKHINNALKEELDDGIPTVAKFGFNGYFPWIGYVVSFRIVLTSPMSKW